MDGQPGTDKCEACGEPIPVADCPTCARKECRICGTLIPHRASKCTECGSYQGGWRILFGSVGTVTAALALVPLWFGAVSAFSLAFPADARLRVHVPECRRAIQIYVSNSGGTTAIVGRPVLSVNASGGSRVIGIPQLEIDPIEEDDLSIEPGEVDIVRISGWLDGQFIEDAERAAPDCEIRASFPIVSWRGNSVRGALARAAGQSAPRPGGGGQVEGRCQCPV